MNQDQAGHVTIPEWTAELVDAFDAEARQLDTLIDVLRRQREGVAQHEVSSIQDSVYAIHRVLLTLDEARKRRRTLLEVIDGDPVTKPDPTERERVRASKERLLGAARSLETELALSRQVLETALADTDVELRSVLDGLEESATYAADAEPDGSRSGLLVDRQV